MNDRHWQRVETIFHACMRLPADQRADALERHCHGDAGLRADVEAVLEASRHADGFIEGILQEAAGDLQGLGLDPSELDDRPGRIRLD